MNSEDAGMHNILPRMIRRSGSEQVIALRQEYYIDINFSRRPGRSLVILNASRRER